MEELLTQHIEQRLQQAPERPLLSLPETLLRLRSTCRDPNSDVYRIESEVTKDPGFSAYLLALANSALYGIGKQPCRNALAAIRRLGVHAVGELSTTYALRGLHQMRGIAPELVTLLEHNWQRSWHLAQNATHCYWQWHTETTNNSAQSYGRVDVSDVLTSGVLYFSGVLACYSEYSSLVQQQPITTNSQQLEQTALTLNTRLLPHLLKHFGYEQEDCQALLQGLPADASLHYSDFLHTALFQQYGRQSLTPQLKQRLENLALLPAVH